MEIKRLTAFSLVAQNGSLLQAANILKLTLPAVSLQLKKLEEELGVKLFHHLPNRLILTQPGRVFLERANRILQAVEDAKTVTRDHSDAYMGKLSISLGSDLATFFAPHFASFVKKHPHLAVTILARPSPETLSLVYAGEADVGVGRFKNLPRRFKKRRLFEIGVSLVLPQQHPLARKGAIQLRDLTSYRLILLTRNSPMRMQIDQLFLRNHIELQDILEVSTCQSALDFVRLGLGVALIHDICALSEPGNLIRAIDVNHYFKKDEVSLIHRSTLPLTMAHCGLIDTLVEAASGIKPLS